MNRGEQIVLARNDESCETIVKKARIQEYSVKESFWNSYQMSTPGPVLKFEELFKPTQVEKVQTNESPEELEIVNNLNQKILIKVPARPQCYTWDKLNFPQKPSHEEFFNGINNPFDYEFRDDNFNQGGFRLNYQSGYAPVDLQTKNKDPSDYTGKSHFIRHKQSQANLNLKRTCGVSYVKQSESEQLNVNHIFKKLPPLVFQCSSGCQNLEGWNDEMDHMFQNLLNGKSVMVCTLFQSQEESIMRDYLLNPQLRNNYGRHKVILVKKLSDIWMLCQDALCLVIHYQYDEQQLLKTITLNEAEDIPQQLVNFVGQSQIQICLLFKKSVSGRKAFLKSVGLWNESGEDQSPEVSTPSTKFVIVPPKVSIGSETTAESLFQQFTAIINKQQIVKIQESEKETVQKPCLKDKKNKKLRQKQQPGSDIKKNSGASQMLLDFLTKEDGYNNINTCSIRMELYVNQDKWQSASVLNQELLNAFMKRTEQHLQNGIMIKMMNKRFKACQAGVQYVHKYSSKIKEVDTSNVNFTQPVCDKQWVSEIQKQNLLTLSTSSIKLKQFPVANMDILKLPKDQSAKELSYLQQPLYCITTRDSFAYDLIETITYLKMGHRIVKRTDYSFDPKNCPANFRQIFLKSFPDYRVGVVAYTDYFTHQELLDMEQNVYETELKAFDGHFLPMTAQISFASANHHTSVRRTKFFFGYRYMWTKCQLAEPHSMVAAGVRRDVSQTPIWMKNIIEQMEQDKMVPKNFINSIACNVYHDGKEGLAQHFDDAVRFKQPIFTIRVFSDCRLSFGSQFYGFCNGAFAVPLPRGCILVMEEGSYAANGIKHCVRPCDMTGKSAALILRQMHEQVTQEAEKYDEFVDLPCHMSTLSIDEQTVPYGEQKRMEAEILLNEK